MNPLQIGERERGDERFEAISDFVLIVQERGTEQLTSKARQLLKCVINDITLQFVIADKKSQE